MPQLLQFIVDGKLGCFQFLLTTSDSSRTFLYTTSAHVYAFLLGIYLVMECMGHREYINICSSSNCYYFCLFISTYTSPIPQIQLNSSHIPSNTKLLLLLQFFLIVEYYYFPQIAAASLQGKIIFSCPAIGKKKGFQRGSTSSRSVCFLRLLCSQINIWNCLFVSFYLLS